MTKLDLNSGQTIHLRELRQWQIYEGLLEGLPTKQMNAREIKRIVAENSGRPYPGDPFLIQPAERPVEYGFDKPYPFGIPAALPGITCVGRFESLVPTRDRAKDASGLVVIWFQEEFAFPIEPEVMVQIQAIDWQRHAIDLEF